VHSPIKVLVTGASGFVGRYVVELLRKRGNIVLPVGRTAGDAASYHVDVCDRHAVASLFATLRPDAVVHLAAIAHRKRTSITDAKYDSVNRRGLGNVLSAARAAGAQRFVFFSSAAVYGEGARGALTEEAERRPIGAYAVSKRDAEDVCLDAVAAGYSCVILRLPAIYAREWLLDVRKRAYLPGFNGKLLLEVPGRQPSYSLCAVQHAAEAVSFAIEGRLAEHVYNVADSEPYSQREIRELIGVIDGVRRTVRVPRTVAKMPLTLTRPLPSRVRRVLWANFYKLFEGQTLDVSKLLKAGLQLRKGLQNLTSIPAPSRFPL
jgi:nucleoside-diphosphate-sugar epimerase